MKDSTSDIVGWSGESCSSMMVRFALGGTSVVPFFRKSMGPSFDVVFSMLACRCGTCGKPSHAP